MLGSRIVLLLMGITLDNSNDMDRGEKKFEVQVESETNQAVIFRCRAYRNIFLSLHFLFEIA
jgi:hypothetical protein